MLDHNINGLTGVDRAHVGIFLLLNKYAKHWVSKALTNARVAEGKVLDRAVATFNKALARNGLPADTQLLNKLWSCRRPLFLKDCYYLLLPFAGAAHDRRG